MVVDLQVAVTVDGEVEQAVLGERFEHVVEEADSGVDGGLAVAVDDEGDLDVGLGRLPGHGRLPVAHTTTESGQR
jgi:hypothetical protein